MSIVQTSRIQTLRNSVRADVGPRTLFLILSHRQEKRFGLGNGNVATRANATP
jgi:hypothetical protein